MKNKYPIYVISKGRWETPLTANALAMIGANYKVVVESQEYDSYARVIRPESILALPFSNLGQGSIPARNWVWEHATNQGVDRHWILDDNIYRFHRLHQNKKWVFQDATPFAVIEDFVDRYVNLPMAGMNYELLIPAKKKTKPITWNTRIYSCILLSNNTTHRWRGRYNEDTDLSLRFLKAGNCTALFNAFLCKKVETMRMKGGNTDQLYKQDAEFDGRLEMARSLQRQHPDVAKVTRKFNRWQHHVDYRPFKGNKLIRKAGIDVQGGINNYGMALINLPTKTSESLVTYATEHSEP